MNRKVIFVLFVLMSLSPLICLALNFKIYVKASNGYPVHNIDTGIDYATIQEAINAASDGHTIIVDVGIYKENIVVNKSVSLIGEDAANTIIDGMNKNTVVNITANNVLFEGFTIQNASIPYEYKYPGIILYNVSGCQVKKNILFACYTGVHANQTARCQITKNNFTYCYICAFAVQCREFIVEDNKAYNYNGGGMIFGFCNDSLISRNDVSNFVYSLGSTMGIYIVKCNNVTLCENIACNNTDTMYYSSGGIVVEDCVNCTVTKNRIKDNQFGGLGLTYGSRNNVVSGNYIANQKVGVYLLESSNNTFYHNNLVNNTHQVFDASLNYTEYSSSVNDWDNNLEGNYWSNYTGKDLNHDGIGDTEHIIYASNQDNCPLMGMFSSFNTSLGLYVNIISNSTIENFEYFESNSTIKMHVSNATAGQTFGFCRVCIPHALMTEPYHVIIDDAEPHYVNYTLHDDGENRWIYFSYEHSTLEIIIIPEFPSFILPLFIIATLLAVIVHRRKHFVQM